ncbi:MAG TPA: apolipoprotein N-acyltransferase [Pyrinomonadaceae bacterium]
MTQPRESRFWSAIRASLPTPAEASLVSGSALLTVLSFPDFDLWFLAWISLAPLLIVIARSVTTRRAFVAGWLWGTIFFYGTCWWLTYPMIHYAHISAWLAYPLVLLPILLVALFPALCCAFAPRLIARFGISALILIPFLWISFDWLRYVVTGQVWNAIGYSQAFHPMMIQTARWGGIYTPTLLILISNAAIALFLIRRRLLIPVVCMLAVGVALIAASGALSSRSRSLRLISRDAAITLIGIQPNVPMDVTGDDSQMNVLFERHLVLTRTALKQLQAKSSSGDLPRLVIWPESPMNFTYSRDPHLRQVVGDFAHENHTSILLNSLEPGLDGGDQNSAVMVNEQGAMAARYDKIRLMPFGEYVPLPRWLPGASSVRGIVGEFTPGSSYTLMPLGALRVGVFICIEAAHPGIARSFTNEGADVLINISNDGYLGPTPVMRQHLANAIFRAVENDRDLVRVTNTGTTAFISSTGQTFDATPGFQEATRTWTISKINKGTTFYSRHGDAFVYACALISLGFVSASFMKRRSV